MKHVEDYLKEYTVEDLKQVAKTVGVKGFSKLKKDELIEAVVELQKLPETASYAYQYIDGDSFKSLQSAVKGDAESFTLEEVFGLYIMGYAFEDEQDVGTFFISETIKKLYSGADTKDNYENRLEIQRWLNLVRASLHLYGIVSFEQVVHLFKKYYDETVTSEEVVSFLRKAPYDITINLDEEELVIEDMNDEQYLMIKKLQGGRPYYEPEFAKFIKFSQPNYIDESSYHQELKEFVEERLTSEGEDSYSAYIELLQYILQGSDRSEVIQYLSDRGVEFKSQEEEKAFFDNISGIVKNIRHFKYRGFKESELNTKTVVKEFKVGRNDPCPCGSGRKYKKCCGK
jgi:acylphosphatase